MSVMEGGGGGWTRYNVISRVHMSCLWTLGDMDTNYMDVLTHTVLYHCHKRRVALFAEEGETIGM